MEGGSLRGSLTQDEHEAGLNALGSAAAQALDQALAASNDVFMLAVPLAQSRNLHWLCGVDSLADEQRVLAFAGQLASVLEKDEVQGRVRDLMRAVQDAWLPETHGERALLETLAFFNSDHYADLDRRSQWDVLQEFDGEDGVGRRRALLWHARNAEITAEIFRALGRGPGERILVIIGASHRPFLEAMLASQPWVKVEPAKPLLDTR